MHAGDVEITADGAALRIEPIFENSLVERNGRLVIPASKVTIGNDFVYELKRADQK
jgi:hypothetical protein